MEKDTVVIDFEDVFKDDHHNLNIKVNKWPFIISLLIYGIFMVLNIVATLMPVEYVTNLAKIVELKDDAVIILTTDDFNNNEALFNDYQYLQFVYDDNFYYLINKNDNYNLELIDIDSLFSEVETLFGNNKKVIVVYNSHQSLPDFKNSPNFVEISNFYNYRDMAINNFVSYLVLIVPFVLLLFVSLKKDVLKFFKNKEFNGYTRLLNTILPFFLVRIISGMIANAISVLAGVSNVAENQVQIERAFSGGAFFMVITVVLFAPIVEELIFRKSIFSLFKNKKTALIVSVSAFTFIHIITEVFALFSGFSFNSLLQLVATLVPYLAMAIFLGWAYKENEENITIVILLHTFANFIAALAILL